MVEGAAVKQRKSLFGLLLSGILLTAGAARADGLAAGPGDLPAEAKKTLAKDVAAYKASHPEAFTAVAEIRGIVPEVYRTYQRPDPIAAPELKRLGAKALLPMLSALALDAPARTLSEKEKTAYVVGLLEATGALRDARSGPVVTAVFEGKNKPAEVVRAAAEAMGKLCGDAELASLKKHAAAGDALRGHALRGLGECRRKESADHLAGLLAAATDAAAAEPIAEALGAVASSWAWKAKGAAAEATAKQVQAVAAKALVAAFARHKDARGAAKKALRLVESPDAPALIAAARTSAAADAQGALDDLSKALAPKQP